MTIQSLNEDTRYHLFGMLDERDLHAISRTCKPLQREASQNDLWESFLAKRFIEPTGDNKQRLTRFFQSYCRDAFLRQKSAGIDPAKHWISIAGRDVFDRYLSVHQFVLDWVSQAELDRELNDRIYPESVRGLLDSGARISRTLDTNQERIAGTLDRCANSEAPSETFLVLLKAGAQPSITVDLEGSRRFGTLDRALRRGKNGQTILALLDAGAAPSATVYPDPAIVRPGSLDTALEYLVHSTRVIPSLLRAGAPLSNRVNNQQNSSLDRAIHFHCSPDTITVLLNAGAQVYDTVGDHLGTLDYAIQQNSTTEVIKALLNGGARPSQTVILNNARILGSLNFAIEHRRSAEVIHTLLTAGARLDERVDATPGTLDEAIRRNSSPEVIQLLLNAGARLYNRTYNSQGTLDHAILCGCSPEVIKVLMDAGAKPTETLIREDEFGVAGTLDRAIGIDVSIDVARLLLNAGARLSETTEAHEGSLERARRLGRAPPMIRLLEEAAVRQGIRIVENRPVAHEPLNAQQPAAPAAQDLILVLQPDPLPEVEVPPNIFFSWVSSAFDAVVGFFQELGWRIARAVVRGLFGY